MSEKNKAFEEQHTPEVKDAAVTDAPAKDETSEAVAAEDTQKKGRTARTRRARPARELTPEELEEDWDKGMLTPNFQTEFRRIRDSLLALL